MTRSFAYELTGVPLRVTVGECSLKEGKVELAVWRALQMSAVVGAVGVMRALQAATDAPQGCRGALLHRPIG